MYSEDKESFSAECDCGHGILRFTQFLSDDEFLIEYFSSVFYSKQDGVFWTIWNRIKFAWSILRGKEFFLYDILLTEKESEKFRLNLKEFVNKDGFTQ